MTVRGLIFKVYKAPEKKLRNYQTSKDNALKGKFKRPDDKWMTEQTSLEVLKYDQVIAEKPPNDPKSEEATEEDKPLEEAVKDMNIEEKKEETKEMEKTENEE